MNLIDFVGLSSNCKELLEELESLNNKLNNLIADLLEAEDEYRDMTDCLGAIPECVPWFTLKEWFDTAEAIRQIKKDIPSIRSECEKIKNDYEASCELVVGFHNYCAQ